MADEIKVEINLEAVTFGDFEKFGGSGLDTSDLVAFLDRVVVGGVRHLPLTMMRPIMDAFKAQMDTLGNPLDAEKKV